jgi:hypothetical protein
VSDWSDSLAGWHYSDDCVICPRCNAWIPCDNDLPSILAAPAGHDCYQNPGTGWYLTRPEAPAPGWYWREPDGTLTRIARQGMTPAPPELNGLNETK